MVTINCISSISTSYLRDIIWYDDDVWPVLDVDIQIVVGLGRWFLDDEMVDGVPLLGGGGGQRVLVLSLAGVLLKIFLILEIVNLKLK